MNGTQKIRLLVIDDSTSRGGIVVRAFKVHDEVEVVGVANELQDGLRELDELTPDVITLSMELCTPDNCRLLRTSLGKARKRPAVVAVGSDAEAKGDVRPQALDIGDHAYVTIPRDMLTSEDSISNLRKTLEQKIIMTVRSARGVSEYPTPLKAPVDKE